MKLLILIEYLIQKILPKPLRMAIAKLRIFVYGILSYIGKPYYIYLQKKQEKLVASLHDKSQLRIVFFVFQDSIWKYEELYRRMEKHDAFEPIVVVIPYKNYGKENMLSEMEKTYNSFISKKYKTIKAYQEKTQSWLDVKKELNPDIIYFTTPHRLTTPEYLINNYTDRLTAYVPYGIMAANIEEEQYNQIFHNLAWRCYYETPIHKQLAEKFADNNGKNVVVTGFPGCDIFMDKTYKPVDVWKNKNPNVKRIIWAPHHTIEANTTLYSYSNFMDYHRFFLSMVEYFGGALQIAFKPHPILKLKLYEHPDWGITQTNDYYQRWNTELNCQLEEGAYEDLFLTSDGIIHDSISFISEYCYTGKPALFMVRDEQVLNMFNEFGKTALKLSYLAKNEQDIYRFVENVIIKKEDSLENERTMFVENVLTPENGKTASENIFNDALKIIGTNED